MNKEMITGNKAAAWGARLAEVDYIPSFPITPQTEIVEIISDWVNNGLMKARYVNMDSEHSMIAAAGAGAATGARVFTATSSQGLLYGIEMLYTISGWRVPLVIVNVSRALSAPITLEPDHNDVLAARDSGFIQIHTETCQEVLDTILMAYKIAEDERVLLPVLVNMDGFYLSFTREGVDIPEIETVREFLPQYKPLHACFKASRPMAQGVAVLGGAIYSFFKYQTHYASCNAISVHEEVSNEFKEIFGRRYNNIEEYLMDDAEYIILMTNSYATKGKAAVHTLREMGYKVGLIRLRLIRPLPVKDLIQTLSGRKGAAVIDQNISPGLGGILYNEVASALYHETRRPDVLLSFIGGLGGKDISLAEFEHIMKLLIKGGRAGDVQPCPHLLYVDKDWQHMEEMLKAAGKIKVNLQ